LLLAVWTAWIYNAWFTNWFDPDRRVVRLVLVGVMMASLLMSATLPEAFGERGLVFAGSYVAIQVGRTMFVVAALREQPELRRNFQRVLAWLVTAGALWLAGGLGHGTAREVLWLAAVVVDLIGPMCGFLTPTLGRSRTTDWTIAGWHMAERCQLFIIIALGESILVTGAVCGRNHISDHLTTIHVVPGHSPAEFRQLLHGA
jgi:low temperature requirement protein LtrA